MHFGGQLFVIFVVKQLGLLITLIYSLNGQTIDLGTPEYPSNTTSDSIKSVVNELLVAISNNDSTKASQLVLRDGHVMRVSETLENIAIRFRTNETFIQETGTRSIKVNERM